MGITERHYYRFRFLKTKVSYRKLLYTGEYPQSKLINNRRLQVQAANLKKSINREMKFFIINKITCFHKNYLKTSALFIKSSI